MTDIIADQPSRRTAYTAGLRALADFLDAASSVPCPQGESLYLPLHTNDAVEAFAAEQGVAVEFDAEGNAISHMHFGPIDFQVYGYVDFTAHLARRAEQQARTWAEKHGMELKPATGPIPLGKSPVAESPADAEAVTA